MVNDIADSPAAVKWMYAIEATLSLTLLYPIARWSEKRFRLEHRLMAGLLIAARDDTNRPEQQSATTVYARLRGTVAQSSLNPRVKRWGRRWRMLA